MLVVFSLYYLSKGFEITNNYPSKNYPIIRHQLLYCGDSYNIIHHIYGYHLTQEKLSSRNQYKCYVLAQRKKFYKF